MDKEGSDSRSDQHKKVGMRHKKSGIRLTRLKSEENIAHKIFHRVKCMEAKLRIVVSISNRLHEVTHVVATPRQ